MPARRGRVGQALDDSGQALSRWLLAQGISMLCWRVTAAIGLALLDAPLAPALGLITGLLTFVPVLRHRRRDDVGAAGIH